MAKHISRVCLIVLVMALCFAVTCTSAFALDRENFGILMGQAIKAANITLESTLPYTAPIEDLIINPFNLMDGVYTAINYTFPMVNLETPSQELDSYLQRTHLTIRGDLITIDGKDYRDIWLDNTFAQACRTNVLDLETAWGIASNSNGRIVTGAGYFDGVPVYYFSNGYYKSQRYVCSPDTVADYSIGNTVVTVYNPSYISPTYMNYNVTLSNGSTVIGNTCLRNNVYFQYESWTPNSTEDWVVISSYNSTVFKKSGSLFVASPFTFDWVSENIPAETLDSSDGLHILVPSDPDDFSDQSIKDAINTINLNIVNNFSTNVSIDLSDGDNYSLFNDLVTDFSPVINITRPSYGPQSEPTPVPTPTPVPWPTPVPTPEPTAEPTPEPTVEPTPDPTAEPTPEPSSEPSPEPSAVPTSPIGDTPFTYLNDGLEKLQDTLSQGFNNLIDSLEFGEADYFQHIVDSLLDAFSALFERIKSFFGIWGYVVGWVGSISAPFNWSLTVLGSAGSYFLSPFAAVAAAAVVIAIYKRFGR